MDRFGGRSPYKGRSNRTYCICKKCKQPQIFADKRVKRAVKQFISKTKQGKSCVLCGETHPACLGFHHIDKKTKLFNIGEAPRIGKTIEQVAKEMAKCQLLCHNCHAKFHYQEDENDRAA